MKINRSSAATLDIIEIAEYIANDNIDAAVRFVDAVDDCFETIARTPDAGVIRKVGKAPEMRMRIVKGFPNALVFYRPTSMYINVIRVIHSARDFYRIFNTDE